MLSPARCLAKARRQKTVHRRWPRLERLVSNEPWDPDKGRWHVPGCLEAEDLEVLSFSSQAAGDARPRPREVRPNLSGDYMLVFDAGGEGRFTLAVPAPEAGRYTIKVHYARAPEFGIVSLRVNGRPAGEPVDTFLKKQDLTRPLWPPREFSFPGVPLKQGTNEFTFSIESKNPQAEGYQVGLDCIVLEKEKPLR